MIKYIISWSNKSGIAAVGLTYQKNSINKCLRYLEMDDNFK